MIKVYRYDPATSSGGWLNGEDLARTFDALKPSSEFLWIDLDGPTDKEEELVFQKFFPIHSLSLEDVKRQKRMPDELPHFMFLIGIQPIGWFVEHQDVRIVNDRLCEARPVAITLRKSLNTLVKHRFQKACFDYAIYCALFVLSAQAPDFRRKVQEPIHRHVRVGGRILR